MLKPTPNLTRIFLGIFLGFSIFTISTAQEIPSDDAVISAGESTFKANCTQCHEIWEVKLGPSLNGVHDKRSVEWLNAWIKNSQALIASGDEEAVALWEEYQPTVMPAYPFTDDQVMEVLAYIKAQTDLGPPVEEVVVEEGVGGTDGNSVSSSYLMAIIVILIVILILALVALGVAIKTLVKYLKDKDLDEQGEDIVSQTFSIGDLIKSNSFVGTVIFVVTIIVLKTLIDGAFTIGVQQGYQPTQPIAFSHKIHAGDYEIECQYCHTGVTKSKSANIPSPNICMNCHSQVKTESEEIQKIYAAIDYDPETKSYGTDTKPIEWVRIHNLPDLAYFNHSQHVNVADLECQTCHGPIEEMEVVYQYSSLTMGWCINCHRETDVNTEGNEYYDKLVKLHSEKSKDPMKVEDIGGLECSKCHY